VGRSCFDLNRFVGKGEHRRRHDEFHESPRQKLKVGLVELALLSYLGVPAPRLIAFNCCASGLAA
jgi:hypothetical protein